MEDKYVAFYTKDPFWFGQIPEVKNIKGNPDLTYDILGEIVFKRVSSQYDIIVSKDGCTYLHIYHLEEKFDQLYKHKAKNDKLGKTSAEYNNNQIQVATKYLEYINSFQLILASKILQLTGSEFFRPFYIDSYQAFPTEINEDGKIHGGLPRDITINFYLGRRFHDFDNLSLTQRLRFFPTQALVDEKILDHALDEFDKVFVTKELPSIMNQVSLVLNEYYNLDFKTAIIQGWFVIEFFINELWDVFLNMKNSNLPSDYNGQLTERINKKRNEFLKGRDFTTSIVSNILELNGYIPLSVFEDIDKVRKLRNAIVHNLSPKEEIVRMDCKSILDLIKYFLKSIYKIDLDVNPKFVLNNLDIYSYRQVKNGDA